MTRQGCLETLLAGLEAIVNACAASDRLSTIESNQDMLDGLLSMRNGESRSMRMNFMSDTIDAIIEGFGEVFNDAEIRARHRAAVHCPYHRPTTTSATASTTPYRLPARHPSHPGRIGPAWADAPTNL